MNWLILISVEQKRELRRCLAGFITEDEPLAPKTTFKTGGAAAVYLQPETVAELILTVRTLTELELDFQLLGGGTNMLIADKGIREKVVISLTRSFKGYEIVGSDKYSVMVRAEGGVQLAALIRLSVTGGYGGLENMAGIPGTLGGALAMNAGAYGSTIYDNISALSVLHNGELCWRQAAELKPNYRDGGLEVNDIVVAAYFILPRQSVPEIVEKVTEIRRQRRQRLPSGAHAGSVFKNPSGDFAGRMLDEVGCKGMRCGGARVADEHANVIVAESGATSRDITDLMEKMRALVNRRYGVILESEIRLVS